MRKYVHGGLDGGFTIKYSRIYWISIFFFFFTAAVCSPGTPLSPGFPGSPGGPVGPYRSHTVQGGPGEPVAPGSPLTPGSPLKPGGPGWPCIPVIPSHRWSTNSNVQ